MLFIGNLYLGGGALGKRLEEEGFSIDVAASGTEAFQKVTEVPYDLIVIDLTLSREDGFALLHRLRLSGLAIGVLALTSSDSSADIVRALETGADDCLAKSDACEELIARVQALLRRSHRNQMPVLRIGDLHINRAERTVTRAGRAIDLTPREFALLEFLATHRGKVVSRAMICDHIYNDSGPRESNVVDVYIRYLRTKIDKGFHRPLILTRWGQGYLLRNDEGS
jgi:DNA-binding response OmpR family regulator